MYEFRGGTVLVALYSGGWVPKASRRAKQAVKVPLCKDMSQLVPGVNRSECGASQPQSEDGIGATSSRISCGHLRIGAAWYDDQGGEVGEGRR